MALHRYELRLPDRQKNELEALATDLGTTTAELLRIGAAWVLNNSEFLRTGQIAAIAPHPALQVQASKPRLLPDFQDLPDSSVLPTPEAARMLGISVATLRRHPSLKPVRLSPRRIGYRVADLRNILA